MQLVSKITSITTEVTSARRGHCSLSWNGAKGSAYTCTHAGIAIIYIFYTYITSRASVKFLFRSVWKICCPFRRMSSSRVGLVWIAANTACITFSRASTTAIPFTTLSPPLVNAAETCCFTTDRFITSLCVACVWHVCSMCTSI